VRPKPRAEFVVRWERGSKVVVSVKKESLGEYIGSIHTQVYHRPLVIEKERIDLG
jgi:hypothetical protein